jgi:hypothetical protein
MITAFRPSIIKNSLFSFATLKETSQRFGTFRLDQRRFVSQHKMSEAKEFPPQKVRAIVAEVAALLKEKKETVSVAETVNAP